MKKSLITITKNLWIVIILTGLVACGDDADEMMDAIDCTVDVAECLTNGGRQAYSNFSADGVATSHSCFLSIQIGFEIDGTFTWDSDSDSDSGCLELIGFPNFTGQWTLENNKTEIHITPPFFTNTGQTETVFKIIELTEEHLIANAPIMTGATTDILWKRIN